MPIRPQVERPVNDNYVPTEAKEAVFLLSKQTGNNEMGLAERKIPTRFKIENLPLKPKFSG